MFPCPGAAAAESVGYILRVYVKGYLAGILHAVKGFFHGHEHNAVLCDPFPDPAVSIPWTTVIHEGIGIPGAVCDKSLYSVCYVYVNVF